VCTAETPPGERTFVIVGYGKRGVADYDDEG
jgi:hypothetical protein